MAIIGYFSRLRGFYEKVTSFPSGITNDGIYGITVASGADAGNYIRNRKGIINAQEAGILYDGTNQATRINAVFAVTKVKAIIFDNADATDITITGSVNCQGKKLIFKAKNRFIGTHTLDNGVMSCELDDQCFTTGTTLTNFHSDKKAISPENFGAVGNGSDETLILQKTSDTLAKNPAMPKLIRLFNNKIYGSNGWILHNWDSTAGDYAQFTVSIEGELSAFAAPIGIVPRIRNLNLNGFALGLQRITGAHIRGIAFECSAINIPSAGDLIEYRGRPYDSFMTGTGAKDTRYAPNSLLVIDPFRNTNSLNPGNDNYHDFDGSTTPAFNPAGTNFYRGQPGSANAGSTGVTIEDCSFAGATVCVMVSPNGESQQAENLVFRNLYLSNAKAAFGFGQSESKSCYVYGGYCIDRIHTVLDAASWGRGQATPPHVKGFNTAGSCLRIIYGGNAQHAVALTFYCEQLYQIGSSSGGPGTLEFLNCSISFAVDTQNGAYVMPGYHYLGNNTVFRGCTLRYYDDLFDKRIVIRGRGNQLDTCYVDLPPISVAGQDHNGAPMMANLDVRNCTYGLQATHLFGWPTLKGIVEGRQDNSIAVNRITTESQNELQGNTGRIFIEWNCGGYEDTELVLGSFPYIVNAANKTAIMSSVFTLPGRYILVFDNTTNVYVVLGRVLTNNNDGTLGLDHVPNEFPSGSYTSDNIVISDYNRIKGRFTGTYTYNTNTITNVFGDPTPGEKDEYSKRYIASYNAGTKTITLAGGNVVFHSDEDLYTGSTKLGTEKVTYTRGGIPTGVIYAADPTKFFPGDIWIAIPGQGLTETYIKRTYICKTSGYLSPGSIGQTKQSIWEEQGIVKQFLFSGGPYSVDFNFVVPTPTMVKGGLLLSARVAPITVNIGFTPGGAEIAGNITVAAGEDLPINSPFYAAADRTIYITGITGSGADVYYNVY